MGMAGGRGLGIGPERGPAAGSGARVFDAVAGDRGRVVYKASFSNKDPMEIAFEGFCSRFDRYLPIMPPAYAVFRRYQSGDTQYLDRIGAVRTWAPGSLRRRTSHGPRTHYR